MARHSAINAVAAAVLAKLSDPALFALCQGGVYRNRPQAQTPPYVSLGPSQEYPVDAFGLAYGAIVQIPISVVLSGADPDGEARAIVILDWIMAALDEPAALTVSGWSVGMIEWVETRVEAVELDPTALVDLGYLGTSTFRFHVRQG